MVKEPRPGRVKTRLARDMGCVPATWWYRHQTARLMRRLADPRWRIILAVSPDRAMRIPHWPAHLRLWPQGRGDLGQRMARLFRHLGRGPLCIIGADIPGITRAHIAESFAALGRHDMVFGPAFDGGYWLVGMRRVRAVPPRLFERVRWSGPHALADSIATAPDLRIGRVARLRDVDRMEDLHALQAEAISL